MRRASLVLLVWPFVAAWALADEAPPPYVGAGNPIAAIPIAELSEMRSRPLFSPSRRPPPPIAATARGAEPPKAAFRWG